MLTTKQTAVKQENPPIRAPATKSVSNCMFVDLSVSPMTGLLGIPGDEVIVVLADEGPFSEV